MDYGLLLFLLLVCMEDVVIFFNVLYSRLILFLKYKIY